MRPHTATQRFNWEKSFVVNYCLPKYFPRIVLLLLAGAFSAPDFASAQEELSVDDQIRLLEEKKMRLQSERHQLENADGATLQKMEKYEAKTAADAAKLRTSIEDLLAQCEKLSLEPGDNLARAHELLQAGAQMQSSDPHSAGNVYQEAYTIARAAFDAGWGRRLDRAKTMAIEAQQRVTPEMRALLPRDAKTADDTWIAAGKYSSANKREAAVSEYEKASGIYAAMVSRYPKRKQEVEEGAIRGKDISGKWVIRYPDGTRNENSSIMLKQKGTKITGTVEDRWEDGQKASMHGAKLAGTYEHGSFIYVLSKVKWAQYHAQISEDGNELVVHFQEITKGDDSGKMRKMDYSYVR